MQDVFQPDGGTLMTWHWKHRNGNACTSDCGRWVITQLDARRFELWDCKEKVIAGVFDTIDQAMREAK